MKCGERRSKCDGKEAMVEKGSTCMKRAIGINCLPSLLPGLQQDIKIRGRN
jgi:hypothetical protein